jgi:hypothetical protein
LLEHARNAGTVSNWIALALEWSAKADAEIRRQRDRIAELEKQPHEPAGLREAAEEAMAIIQTVKHSPPFSARIERCLYLLRTALTPSTAQPHCQHLLTTLMHFLEPSAIGIREQRLCSDCGVAFPVQTTRQPLTKVAAVEPPAKPRNLQSLCDRLAEVFNMDDTPEELSTEAREAIEELWESRDAWMKWAQHLQECTDCHVGDLCTIGRPLWDAASPPTKDTQHEG